jgi:putative hydrolase of the HAD superfamily
MMGQISEQEHLEITCLALEKPVTEWRTFREAFFAGDGIDYELVDFIRSLRPGYKTGILSNAWSGVRQWLTEKWRIMDAFDEAVISAEVGLVKPDPRIYELVLQALDVQPAEAVFVDDFLENVEAARRGGLHAIQFLNPSQAVAEINQILKSM